MEISLNIYIYPYDSIDQMFKALIAFKKIKHYQKIDINIVKEVIEFSTKKVISNDQLESFIDKIKNCSSLYPLNTICDKILDSNINEFINSKCYTTLEIITDLKICSNCNQSLDNSSIDDYGSYKSMVFYSNKPTENCLNSFIKCKFCMTRHFKCYYIVI